MTKLPIGYIKMDLVLRFKKSITEIIETQILKMIIRDYYIFYSKKKVFPKERC